MEAVSVVIPVKDRDDLLRRALSSVAEQTRLPQEVIVVDDGSARPVKLEHGAFSGLNVRVIRHSSSKGAAAAKNYGVSEALGDIVFFLDSDDQYATNHIENAVDAWAHEFSDVGLIATGAWWCDITGRPYRKHRCYRSVNPTSLAKYGNFVGGNSVFSVRKQAFMSIGGYGSGPADDYELLFRISERYKIKAVTDLTVLYTSPTLSTVQTMTSRHKEVGKRLSYLLRRYARSYLSPSELAFRRCEMLAVMYARAGYSQKSGRFIRLALKNRLRFTRLLLEALASNILSAHFVRELVRARAHLRLAVRRCATAKTRPS